MHILKAISDAKTSRTEAINGMRTIIISSLIETQTLPMKMTGVPQLRSFIMVSMSLWSKSKNVSGMKNEK